MITLEGLVEASIGVALIAIGVFLVSMPGRHATLIRDFYRRRNKLEDERGWPADHPFLPGMRASLVIVWVAAALFVATGTEVLLAGVAR